MQRLFPPIFVLLCCLALLIHGPIPQLPNYHAFADQEIWMGIPHGTDVLSNLGFALIGLWGIFKMWPARHVPSVAAGFPAYALFMLALILTALGSSYYHLNPDNDRLVWDRLPIALACVSLMAGVWADTTLAKSRVLAATGGLAVFAVGSVLWWYITELKGQGDLRPYLLLQILPIVLIPLMQAIHRAPIRDRAYFGAAIALYVAAKLAEINDHTIHELTSASLSGHTLKHLLATTAAGLLAYRLVQRTEPSIAIEHHPALIRKCLLVIVSAAAIIALAPWHLAHAQEKTRPRLIDTFSGPPDRTPEAIADFIQKTQKAIDSGADIDAMDKYGNNPLLNATYWAAWSDQRYGYNDIVAMLLSRGANPNVESNGVTPLLFVATGAVNLKLIEILCSAGANPTTKISPHGMSALEMSRKNHFSEIAKALTACASRRLQ